jgi:hypothetical protein
MKKRYITPTTKVFKHALHLPLLQASVTVKGYNRQTVWFGTIED